MLDLKEIDQNWTLFLDRDGVINYEKKEDYIYSYEEFRFYEGTIQALQYLSTRFQKLIIITNQRGVGRSLMTEQDLNSIHNQMVADIEEGGGRIHKIYYSTATDNSDPRRKPNQGMIQEALRDFPEIDPGKSIMIGNNLSDMEFGRNAGMHTVFVKTTNPKQALPHPLIDISFNDLQDFAKALQNT